MLVDVIVEQRFDRARDGSIWTRSPLHRSYWERYLEAFAGVRIVARVREVVQVPDGARRANGDRIAFEPVPNYVGPGQFACHWRAVGHRTRAAVRRDDAVILRIPSVLAGTLYPRLQGTGHRYAVEVVGDPREVLASKAAGHPVAPIARRVVAGQQLRQCANAVAAAYTSRAMRDRYPCPGLNETIIWRPVEDEWFVATPHERTASVAPGAPAKLITVGTLATPYKGLDVLLDAIARIRSHGVPLELTVIGGGREQPHLEKHARKRGIAEIVNFLGELPAGPAVRSQLDLADMFVLASRAEGLPVALIEAMARGLPCVATEVGGVPEVLGSDDLVPVNDSAALAAKLGTVLASPARLRTMAERNLRTAQVFRASAVNARWTAYYHAVRELCSH